MINAATQDDQPINNANEFENRTERKFCVFSFVMNTFDEKLICRFSDLDLCVNS